MSSDAYQSLPQNRFERAIKDARSFPQQIKARQRLSSVGGQLNYEVKTSNDWDIASSLSTGTSIIKNFEIIYTADGTQENPTTIVSIDVRFGGTADINKVNWVNNSYSFGGPGYDDGTNKTSMVGLSEDLTYLANPYVSRWTLRFVANVASPSLAYYMKPTIFSSSGGTLTMAEI